MTLPVYLGLGSNLGDRLHHLQSAVYHLQHHPVRLRAWSSAYRSEPYGLQAQPWFVNAVICVETPLDPYHLLHLCKRIERQLGRNLNDRWGPRVIDIDILLYGRLVLDDPVLTIPHPGLPNRRFVLDPLLEIEPRLIDPRSLLPLRYLRLCHPSRPCEIHPWMGPQWLTPTRYHAR